jgi:hypothetical protein
MNQNLTSVNPIKTAFILALSVCLLTTQAAKAEGKPFRKFGMSSPIEEEPAKKKKEKAGSLVANNNNNSTVKIYPDIVKRDMHVVAKKNDGQEINFFVFDVEGTLVQNYKMKARDHFRIAGLKKGLYIYRAFCGDEERAAGKFEIR